MVREAISEVSCRIRCHIAAGNIAVAQLDETGAQTVIAARGFHTAADEIAETLIFAVEMLIRCAPGTPTLDHRLLV
jgi:prolyl-tRNA editing enzyme YbaK/EbsC (Cys-tRNA(Pro) deacylase)